MRSLAALRQLPHHHAVEDVLAEGMPNTRLSSVILSSVFSPVAMLYTGSSFTGNANGSSSGFSTPHAHAPSPPSFGASSEKSSIVRLAGICRFFNSGFSSYSLSVLI